ncbi:hypothetical protein VIGAN_UM017700, partial [Vigna angularis var. angularis]
MYYLLISFSLATSQVQMVIEEKLRQMWLMEGDICRSDVLVLQNYSCFPFQRCIYMYEHVITPAPVYFLSMGTRTV